VKGDRLSNRQIAALKHLAICCANGGQVTLTRDQREALTPLWRKNIVEIWWRRSPDDRALQGPFFRPTAIGWNLINSILAASRQTAEAA
jgi:hypothetical protein